MPNVLLVPDKAANESIFFNSNEMQKRGKVTTKRTIPREIGIFRYMHLIVLEKDTDGFSVVDAADGFGEDATNL